MAVGGVRAGRPSGGSGGLENYAVPLLGMVLMLWLVSRFGPVVAQRISRLLVGVEPELDFGNKGKLKGKGKRSAKGWSAPTRSPAKRSNGTHGSSAPPVGDNEDDDDDDERKPAGSSSYQELAPLASYQDAEATATANALMESVEWQVQEGKRPRGTPKSSPKHKPSPSPSKPQAPSEPQPPPRELRLAFEDDVLRRIASGVQQYEARLNKGAWRSLSAGDVFVAHSTQREVTLDVYSATRFPSFGDAWTELGTDLVPIRQGVRSKQQADDAYAASQGASASEVKAHGVLALRLQVIFVEMVGDPTATDSRGASSSDAPVVGGSSSAAGGSAGGSSASAGGAGGLSAGSASSPQCSLPPSAADSEPTSNGGGSGSGKGKAPYRRPGGGKAPASSGKAPRISD